MEKRKSGAMNGLVFYVQFLPCPMDTGSFLRPLTRPLICQDAFILRVFGNSDAHTLRRLKLGIAEIVLRIRSGAEVTAVKGGPPQSIRAFERFLRDAGGYSRAHAGAIAHGGFKALAQRDAESGTAELVASLRRATAILNTPTTNP
ncbi:MAG: hypothetical protein IIC08_07310 [Proteobacteria bacterium]|nr:hypothetical protein [Pseudomonadota bacterium]